MESHPLVSIITIVYNGEAYIADSIRSIQRQTYPNIQYIIVDGGSTDNTLGIIRQFGGVVTDIVSERDEGISDAFNKGLIRARGEIVGMINADDWYEDDAVEKSVRAIEGFDVVYGDLRLWRAGRIDSIFKGNHSRLQMEMRVNHPTVFVRKSCYDRLGLFDKQYKCAMDYDLLLRLLVNRCRFNHIPEVTANMRWEGVSYTGWMQGLRETLSIQNKYLPQRSLLNKIHFFRQVLTISTRRFLQRFGSGFVNRA